MNAPISARVDRSGIYPALTVLLLACLVGLVSTCDRPRRTTLAWAIGSTLSIGALWATREEWLLLVPALVCGIGLGDRARRPHVASRDPACRGRVRCGLHPVVDRGRSTCGSSRSTTRITASAITNVEQTSMSAGLGPMFRVDAGDHVRPVSGDGGDAGADLRGQPDVRRASRRDRGGRKRSVRDAPVPTASATWAGRCSSGSCSTPSARREVLRPRAISTARSARSAARSTPPARTDGSIAAHRTAASRRRGSGAGCPA